MAVIFQTTDVFNTNGDAVANGSGTVTVANNDHFVLFSGTSIGASNEAIDVDVDDFTATIHGSVYGQSEAFDFGRSTTLTTSFDHSITISDTGSAASDNRIAFFGVFSTGIAPDPFSQVNFTNAGFLSSNNEGIKFQTVGNAFLNNAGTIQVTDIGVGDYAVEFINVADAQIINSGLIQGIPGDTISYAIIDANTQTETLNIVNTGQIVSPGFAIDSNANTSESIFNSGSIEGRLSLSGIGGLLENSGEIVGDIDNSSGDDTVLNSGSVQGDLDLGNGEDELQNAGSILGDIEFGNDSDTDTFLNSGEVLGDVIFDESVGGDDIVINSGLITGAVDLGEGDDSYTASGTGLTTVEVFGGSGSDTLRGGQLDDKLVGGDDVDILFGGSGNDDLNGGNDNDVMSGNSGEDVLKGGAGIDKLIGGKGNDDLIGGADRDNLFGGSGEDVFDFNDVTHSVDGATDAVRDFTRGEDVIDLVDTTGLNILFNDTSGFLGGGDASLFYTVNGKGQAIVRVDTTGDGAENMRIQVNNHAELDINDFAL